MSILFNLAHTLSELFGTRAYRRFHFLFDMPRHLCKKEANSYHRVSLILVPPTEHPIVSFPTSGCYPGLVVSMVNFKIHSCVVATPPSLAVHPHLMAMHLIPMGAVTLSLMVDTMLYHCHQMNNLIKKISVSQVEQDNLIKQLL